MTIPVSDRQFASAQALLAVLQREYSALLAGDFAIIEQIVQEKRLAIAELEAIGQLQATEVQAKPHMISGLQALAAECARQNDINGGIVEASLRHTQHVLTILHGQSPDSGLYSRAGATLHPSATRPLTSA